MSARNKSGNREDSPMACWHCLPCNAPPPARTPPAPACKGNPMLPHRKTGFLMIVLAWALAHTACAAPRPRPRRLIRRTGPRRLRPVVCAAEGVALRPVRPPQPGRLRRALQADARQIDQPLTPLQVACASSASSPSAISPMHASTRRARHGKNSASRVGRRSRFTCAWSAARPTSPMTTAAATT